MAWTNVQDLEEVKPTVKEAQIWAEWIKIRVFYHFLKCDSLVFLEIAQDDCLEQCLTTSRGKTRRKSFVSSNLGQMDKNLVQNQVFYFFKFCSLVFPEIAQDDSLEHSLTTSRGKTHGKNSRGPKLSPKLGFLSFSQGCIISFP